jgi:hypothetical protein
MRAEQIQKLLGFRVLLILRRGLTQFTHALPPVTWQRKDVTIEGKHETEPMLRKIAINEGHYAR